MPTGGSSISSQKTPRRSWFSFKSFKSRRRKRPPIPPQTAIPLPATAQSGKTTPDDTRLGPLQFQPNRIQTLYITPSERNLYLAAMEHLDRNPQSLPLWSDPAPTIPQLQLPLPPAIDGLPAAATPHPLTTVPLSPKLVTSPALPNGGLQVREEFRQPAAVARPTRHALLSIVPSSFLRFTGFTPETIVAVDKTLMDNWPLGVSLRSESMNTMRRKRGTGEGLAWRVQLHGQAWKRKGSQELHSIRLLLAILTTLAVHGWSLVSPVQAAGPSKIGHNLIFKYDSRTETRPPVFFALSLPLPDRISLVSMPNKVTPSILTAVRSAIASNVHLVHEGGDRGDIGPQQVDRLTWGSEGKTKGVKIEGWVHPGVYRFWVDGMRRWLGGGIKGAKVDDIHPHLLTTMIDNLHTIDFGLVGSIPLLPITKGRDVLFFSSLPTSGLSYLDTYQDDVSPGGPSRASESRRSETPVIPPAQTQQSSPPRRGPATAKEGRATADADEGTANSRRALPWTSIRSEEPSNNPRAEHQSIRPLAMPNPTPAPVLRQELIPEAKPASTQSHHVAPLASSSKPRNVLLKKSSLRRQQSVSGSRSVELPAPDVVVEGRANGEQSGEEPWTMVETPLNVGPFGQTTYRAVRLPSVQSDTNEIDAVPRVSQPHDGPIRRLPAIPPHASSNTSGDSIYEESSEALHHDRTELVPASQPLPRPAQEPAADFVPPSLALGNALEGSPPTTNLPLREPATGTLKDARVNVPSALGIPSMHGSVGFFPDPPARNEVTEVPPLRPKAGSARTRLSVGK